MSPGETDRLFSLADIRTVLKHAEDKWRSLESCLREAEEATFRTHSNALQGWFGCTDSDLQNWAEGGLRCRVRWRVSRLMLGPLAERMRKAINFAPCAGFAGVGDATMAGHVSSTGPREHILDELRAHWEWEGEAAFKCDKVMINERSSRHSTRKRGCSIGKAPTATGPETSAQRAAFEKFTLPLMRLAAFMESNLPASTGSLLSAAIPAAVARAVCDFYFYGYEAQFRQLQTWWDSAKKVLQQQSVWDRLQQEEGLFIRRIENGVDILDAARRRYEAFADFGASELDVGVANRSTVQAMNESDMIKLPAGAWPSEAISLLASAISDFRTRLKPIRDCAAWRIVEAVKMIRAEQKERVECTAMPSSIWDSIGLEMGVGALSRALDETTFECVGSSNDAVSYRSDPVDAALVFMQRLDRLASIIGELQDFFRSEFPFETSEIRNILEEVLRGVSISSEELLAVLDDPSLDAVATCAQQWDGICREIDGKRLGVAMAPVPVQLASAASLENCAARRHKLVLLRGMQALLEDETIRRKLTIIPPSRPSQRFQAWTDERPSGTPQVPVLSLPPADVALVIQSPRSSYFLQQAKRNTEEQLSIRKETSRDPITSMSVARGKPLAATTKGLAKSRSAVSLPSSCCSGVGRTTLAGTLKTSEVQHTLQRPATPSWLQPPWTRPSMPSESTWARPDTPSTACDDAEAAVPSLLPRWKFVGGDCVLRRPSSAARLPPLNSVVPADGREWRRLAW